MIFCSYKKLFFLFLGILSNSLLVLGAESAKSPDLSNQAIINYSFNHQKILPGDVINLELPEKLRNTKNLHSIILGHYQNASTNKGGGLKDGEWDEVPGLTALQVQAQDGQWYFWNGSASGDMGAKFAEVGYSAEIENLYNWPVTGFRNVDTMVSSFGDLKVQAVRLSNVGQDEVTLTLVQLKFSPEKSIENHTVIFSEGTFIPEPGSKVHETLGGGQEFGGKFPGSLILSYGSPSGNGVTKVKAPFSLDSNSLTYSPIPESEICSVALAIGDSHPDGIKNKDGGIGTKGYAKLSVIWKNLDSGQEEYWLRNENIPPQGVLFAAPPVGPVKAKNHRLIIRVSQDLGYVMGVRVGIK